MKRLLPSCACPKKEEEEEPERVAAPRATALVKNSVGYPTDRVGVPCINPHAVGRKSATVRSAEKWVARGDGVFDNLFSSTHENYRRRQKRAERARDTVEEDRFNVHEANIHEIDEFEAEHAPNPYENLEAAGLSKKDLKRYLGAVERVRARKAAREAANQAEGGDEQAQEGTQAESRDGQSARSDANDSEAPARGQVNAARSEAGASEARGASGEPDAGSKGGAADDSDSTIKPKSKPSCKDDKHKGRGKDDSGDDSSDDGLDKKGKRIAGSGKKKSGVSNGSSKPGKTKEPAPSNVKTLKSSAAVIEQDRGSKKSQAGSRGGSDTRSVHWPDTANNQSASTLVSDVFYDSSRPQSLDGSSTNASSFASIDAAPTKKTGSKTVMKKESGRQRSLDLQKYAKSEKSKAVSGKPKTIKEGRSLSNASGTSVDGKTKSAKSDRSSKRAPSVTIINPIARPAAGGGKFGSGAEFERKPSTRGRVKPMFGLKERNIAAADGKETSRAEVTKKQGKETRSDAKDNNAERNKQNRSGPEVTQKDNRRSENVRAQHAFVEIRVKDHSIIQDDLKPKAKVKEEHVPKPAKCPQSPKCSTETGGKESAGNSATAALSTAGDRRTVVTDEAHSQTGGSNHKEAPASTGSRVSGGDSHETLTLHVKSTQGQSSTTITTKTSESLSSSKIATMVSVIGWEVLVVKDHILLSPYPVREAKKLIKACLRAMDREPLTQEGHQKDGSSSKIDNEQPWTQTDDKAMLMMRNIFEDSWKTIAKKLDRDIFEVLTHFTKLIDDGKIEAPKKCSKVWSRDEEKAMIMLLSASLDGITMKTVAALLDRPYSEVHKMWKSNKKDDLDRATWEFSLLEDETAPLKWSDPESSADRVLAVREASSSPYGIELAEIKRAIDNLAESKHHAAHSHGKERHSGSDRSGRTRSRSAVRGDNNRAATGRGPAGNSHATSGNSTAPNHHVSPQVDSGQAGQVNGDDRFVVWTPLSYCVGVQRARQEAAPSQSALSGRRYVPGREPIDSNDEGSIPPAGSPSTAAQRVRQLVRIGREYVWGVSRATASSVLADRFLCQTGLSISALQADDIMMKIDAADWSGAVSSMKKAIGQNVDAN